MANNSIALAKANFVTGDKRRKSITNANWFWPLIFLLPALVGFCAFTAYPAVFSLILSFTDWDLNNPLRWIGLNNYLRMFRDPTAIRVFWNTVYFTIVTVPVQLIVPLLLAIALNQKIRGIRFFRVAFFLPVISSMVAMSMVWQWIFNADFGLLNWVLSLVGINGPKWLTSEEWALPAVMITSIWKNIGFNMMIFLAGLQGISTSYYEAAEIDGANAFQRFWHITIPSLKPTTLLVTVMAIINSFQVFDQVVVMTGGGTSAMAGYAFSWITKFRGKNTLFLIFLISIMIPYHVLLVPTFALLRNMRLLDTPWAIILPSLVSPFGIFLMRQFFTGVPKELAEAATLDGCNLWGIFWRIFLPLSKPALTTLAIFTFVGTWNDFLRPLIFLSSNENQTLTLGIYAAQGLFSTNWPVLMAMVTLSLLPVVIMFLALQDLFVKGVALTGIKG